MNRAQKSREVSETRFARYMHSLLKGSHDATSKTFSLVPCQDFTNDSDINWAKGVNDIDKQLYKKYSLTADEISLIERRIKPYLERRKHNMARPRKDGVYINYYIDRELVERLRSYADNKGQTMTMALERILIDFLIKRIRRKTCKSRIKPL